MIDVEKLFNDTLYFKRSERAAIQAVAKAAAEDMRERCARVLDSASGKYFSRISEKVSESGKHILGAKVACSMELAAAIRALPLEES